MRKNMPYWTLKLSFLLLFCMITYQSDAQYFEGKIRYKVQYHTNAPGITAEDFSRWNGSSWDTYIKDGNTKTNYNGHLLKWQLIDVKNKRIYVKRDTPNYIVEIDATKPIDKKLKRVKIKDTSKEILGYKCMEISYKIGKIKYKYYYSPELIDSNPENLKAFEYEKIGEIAEIINGATVLGAEIKYPGSRMEYEAVNIEFTELDSSLFELPANAEVRQASEIQM